MAPHVAVQRFPVRLSSGTFSTYLRQQVCSWTRNSFRFLTEQINIPEVKSDFAFYHLRRHAGWSWTEVITVNCN